MAAPNSTNEVTARKLASFATSLWTKLKSWFARKEDGVYYVVGTHSYTAYSTSAPYTKYTSGAYTSANSCVYNGVAYYCSTAITTPEAWTSSHWTKIATPAWEGSIDGVTELTAGLKISYKIPIAGGQSSTYLNINNLGNKYVKRCTGNTTTHLPVNTVVFMTYDGTQWVWADYSVGDNYYTNVMAYCGTAAGTQAKTATSTGFNLAQSANIPFVIRFTNANSYNGALTLNINSQGAKALWINGSASSSSNKTIAAGVYWCYFDGTQFQLWTDKSFPCPAGMRGDVTGTAAYASNAAPNSDLATLLNGFGSSISGLTSAVGGKAALDQNPSRVVYYGTTTKDELIAIIYAGYQPICYYTQSAGGSAWFTYSGKKNGYYFFYAPILWLGVVRTQWLACHSESGNTVWEYAYIDMTADGAAVADVNYDSTHNMITKTKNGQTNDVTSLQEMLQHLPSAPDDVPQSLDGSSYVLPMRGNSTTGSWLMKPLGSVWNWIKWKIEDVLGLTASQYNGNAATASGYAQSGGIASALAAKSAIDHTHPLSIAAAASSQSASLTLAPNTIYTLTAGGSSFNFKTQAGPFFANGGQHVSCLLRVGGSWSNTIEGKVYDARGNVVKTIDSAGSIPALVNQTSDVTELFIKVTSSYSGTGTIGFNFGDIASEKPLRIHVRNSSGYTFRIKLRKESAETTTCTFYTATAADAATSFNMDTSANGTSDWVVMVSGVENNSCYVINRI